MRASLAKHRGKNEVFQLPSDNLGPNPDERSRADLEHVVCSR